MTVLRIEPGKLRERVTIQNRPAGNAGTRGEPGGEFTDAQTVAAAVQYLSGTETQLARRQFATASHEVEMYWTPKLSTNSRLNWHASEGDRVLQVRGIENVDNANQWLILQCEEVR